MPPFVQGSVFSLPTSTPSRAAVLLFWMGFTLLLESSDDGRLSASGLSASPALLPAVSASLGSTPPKSERCSSCCCPPKASSPDGAGCESPSRKDTHFLATTLPPFKEGSAWPCVESHCCFGAGAGPTERAAGGFGAALPLPVTATCAEPPEAASTERFRSAGRAEEEQPASQGGHEGEEAAPAGTPGPPPSWDTKGLLPVRGRAEGKEGAGGEEAAQEAGEAELSGPCPQAEAKGLLPLPDACLGRGARGAGAAR